MSHNTIKFTLYAILIYTDEPCDKIDDTDKQPEQNGKVDKTASNCLATGADDSTRPSCNTSSSSKPLESSTKPPMPKKKKISNFEKGIALMCKSLNETSQNEMER